MAFLDQQRKVVTGSSSFSFKELSGQKRVLRLLDRALPHRPFKTIVRQRNDYSMLPGYAKASLTILGPEDAPTSINGRWSDKYISLSEEAADEGNAVERSFVSIDSAIGATGQRIGLGAPPPNASNQLEPAVFDNIRVNTVRELTRIVDTWCREGRLLEVSWDTHAWHGIIEEVQLEWDNSHDVHWTINFKWISRAEATSPSVIANELSVSSTASLFQKLADLLGTEALPPPFTMGNDLFADVTAGINRIAATTQAIADTIQSVATLVMAPANAVRQVIALSNTIASQATQLVTDLQLTFVSGGQYKRQTAVNAPLAASAATRPALVEPVVGLSFSQRLVVAEYCNRVAGVAKQLRYAAVLKSREFAATLERDLLSVYSARAGDDLRNLSEKFYGTPHAWRRIMVFNGFTAPELTAGQTVLIPRVSEMEGC